MSQVFDSLVQSFLNVDRYSDDIRYVNYCIRCVSDSNNLPAVHSRYTPWFPEPYTCITLCPAGEFLPRPHRPVRPCLQQRSRPEDRRPLRGLGAAAGAQRDARAGGRCLPESCEEPSPAGRRSSQRVQVEISRISGASNDPFSLWFKQPCGCYKLKGFCSFSSVSNHQHRILLCAVMVDVCLSSNPSDLQAVSNKNQTSAFSLR